MFIIIAIFTINYNHTYNMATFPTIIHERNSYIGKIKPFINTPIVKVLIGLRRVGKSYILFQIIDLIKKTDIDANIIYINKEDIQFIDFK